MSDTTSRRWMTYREIAEALGLPSAKAGEAKARRAKWERQIGNDGFARVAVPLSILEELPLPRTRGNGPRPTDQHLGTPYGGPAASQEIKALRDELKALYEGPMQEALRRASAAEAEVAAARQENGELRERAARAEGELAGLRIAFQQEQGRAERAEAEAAGYRDVAAREAAQAAAEREALRAERDTALHRAAEAVAVMGRLVEPLEALQRHTADTAQRMTEAEQRAAAAEAGRQEAEARLAQLAEQAKAAGEGSADLAELEAAVTRAQEAEERATEAKRLAEVADRRATVATERLDRFQRDRILQSQAAAENLRTTIQQEAVPLWRRIFRRRGRP